MAWHDYNKDGKKDMVDDYIEYQLIHDDEDNTSSSSHKSSDYSYYDVSYTPGWLKVVAVILGLYLVTGVFELFDPPAFVAVIIAIVIFGVVWYGIDILCMIIYNFFHR